MPRGSFLNKYSTLSKSIKNVAGSISTKITSPPQYLMQFAEATKVKLVVITLSPGLTDNAKALRCKAAVPFVRATAYLAST